MPAEIDLKKIERKAYLSYHQDGLWDIFLGIFFLGVGIFMFLNTVYLMGGLIAVFVPGAIIIKKWLATGRLGYVKFGPGRQAQEKRSKAKLSMLLTLTMILGIITFYAFTGNSEWQTWIRNLGIIPFGFVLALVLGAVGLLFEMKRFVLYAGLILAVFIAGHLTDSDPPAYFMLLGIIFLIAGLVMLIRFLRKYPKPKGEVSSGVR